MSDYSTRKAVNWTYDDDGKIMWRRTGLQPNRTFIYVDRKKPDVAERNIPYKTTAPAWYRHPVLPNYTRMNLYNDGTWNGAFEDNVLANEQEKWHARHAVGTQIGLTNYQFKRLHGYGIQKATRVRGLRREVVVICLCGIVCYEDGRRTHPNHQPRDQTFETVRDSIGVSDKQYRRWFGKLCARLDIELTQRRKPPAAPTEPQPWSLWYQPTSEEVTI